MPVGTYIKKLLEDRGWTEKKLSEESGVKRSTISLLLIKQGRMPDYQTMRSLAKAFGMATDEFYDNAVKISDSNNNTQIALFNGDDPPEKK